MCRWWSGYIQSLPFLESFQYYMRIDDDSLFTRAWSEDPFFKMRKDGLKYVSRRNIPDKWGIKQMWGLAEKYMTHEKKKNMAKMGYLKRNADASFEYGGN